MTSIAEKQEQKEGENLHKYVNAAEQGTNAESREHAARTLQRTYRSHRTRRELKGLSLTPSARWTEVSSSIVNILHPIEPA